MSGKDCIDIYRAPTKMGGWYALIDTKNRREFMCYFDDGAFFITRHSSKSNFYDIHVESYKKEFTESNWLTWLVVTGLTKGKTHELLVRDDGVSIGALRIE